MGQLTTVVEEILIPHHAFADAYGQIEQAFKYSQDKNSAEGLAVIGESGTGKTSVLQAVRSKHKPYRDEDGMKIPILFASVPSGPTKKGLASVLLAAMHDPDPDRGTVVQQEIRLKRHMEAAGTSMIMIDEFQHFYDRGKHKIMYEVADWLKVLIDESKATLVVAGLPSCMGVIDQNEQLARRFQQRLQLPRFSWSESGERSQFMGILQTFWEGISLKGYQAPSFSEESIAFRFYCATGGLMGYLCKLLKQALRNADSQSKKSILLEDLAIAYGQSIWRNEHFSLIHQPFSPSFVLTETAELMKEVARIGTISDQSAPVLYSRRGKTSDQQINSILRSR